MKVLDVRRSVGVLVYSSEKAGDILVVTNRKYAGYSCPGGTVEDGETIELAARRELREETGLVAYKMKALISLVHEAHPEDEDRRPYLCTYFLAEVGTQFPVGLEKGTEIGWKTAEQLIDEGASLYRAFYSEVFKELPFLLVMGKKG